MTTTPSTTPPSVAAPSMTTRHLLRAGATTAGCALWLLGAGAPAAQAHPLGNFSVNHYTGLTVHPDRVEVLAVTDTAEIPTVQAAPSVDTDGDGVQSEGERAAWATARCAETAGRLVVTARGTTGTRGLGWTVTGAGFEYRPGQASLRTSRLECRLRAPLDLAAGPATLRIDTGADPARVGWNEITARGEDAHLRDSRVPEVSPSDELRDYPRDLLDAPRGDTRAEFTAVAGAAGSDGTRSDVARPGTAADSGPAADLEALSRRLTALVGTDRLTVPVGLLAVLLAVVLGAGHALLPGHGKTVMAAYLAGRRGRTRDAVTVGATVTLTHTAGVLVIGLALTAFSALAGDTVLAWLGLAGGALVTAVGAGLLLDARRRRRAPLAQREHAPGRVAAAGPDRQPALVGAAGSDAAAHDHGHGHEHPHPHPHPHPHGHDHDHDHPHETHRHGLFGHHHSHGHSHKHSHEPAAVGAPPFSTRGLVGLGIAGGLVPSPSALVVLLGAVALGRTVFGAGLVLAYGLGMAATLTAVGLLLVRIGDGLGRLAERPAFALLRRLAPHTALLTALLVLVVGLGLMARSLPPLL